MNTTSGQKSEGRRPDYLDPNESAPTAWRACAAFAAETELNVSAVVRSEIQAWLFNHRNHGLGVLRLTVSDIIAMIEYGQLQDFYSTLEDLKVPPGGDAIL